MAEYDFFAQKKASSLSGIMKKRLYRILEKLFLQYFPVGAHSVIEIGPGDGIFAGLCVKNGFSYKGYEPNGIMCEQLRSQGLAIENACVPPMSEPDGSADAVVMLQVFEHMPSYDIAAQVLAESAAKLKTGGIMFMAFPSFLRWKEDFYNFDCTHTFPTTEIRVQQMLNDAGFETIRVRQYYGCIFSDLGRIPDWIARTVRSVLTVLLPRSISRSVKFQKMGILFAENILVVARKVSK